MRVRPQAGHCSVPARLSCRAWPSLFRSAHRDTLNQCGNVDPVQRQRNFNREDAPRAGHIANADVALVRPHRLSRHREAEAKAGPIAAAPFSKRLKQIAFAFRNAPA